MRRLLDEPEIADLEGRFGADGSREAIRNEVDGFAVAARAVFGLDYYEARDVLENQEPSPEAQASCWACWADEWDQVVYFRSRGWDVTDSIGRPAHVLKHFVPPLIAALDGHGKPLDGKDPVRWGNGLSEEAAAWARGRPPSRRG